jgi:sucrose-6-phosphate hydrolase SacC (GH32 family)
MKWEKIGQIFEFDKSPFKKDYVSHAQSPQALILEDRVRVYFSTRKIDEPGKFLSYVQYVDYDLDLKNIIDYSKREVIALGKTGCFDEHGIFPLSPVKVGDKVYGYTNGISRRISVAVETGVGYAVSLNNGKTFEKSWDGPILSASLHEPFLVGDPFVRVFDDQFHMFYLFGKKWSEETAEHPSERVYKIGHATSTDGINWQKTGKSIIEDKIGENECQALPTVIKISSRYHMYFCYRPMVGFRDKKGKGYQLGYAYSDDLVKWIRDDKNAGISLSSDGWDSEMMCYPNIFECSGQVYLLYNGNNFGRDGFGIAKLISEG